MALISRVRNVLGIVPAEQRLRWWPVSLALFLLLAVWTASQTLTRGQAKAAPTIGLGGEAAKETTAEKIDLAEVERKIAALAKPDQTVPYDQQADIWLGNRREQIVPQLIAAMDDKNAKVAEQCLYLLHDAPASKELTDALIAKAGDEKSPLRVGALQQLEKSAADPRVAALLDRASTQVEIFPNPRVRAKWAWQSGHKDRAVEILKPLLQKVGTVSFDHVLAIRLLGEIDAPSSIALLEPIAAGDNWGLAVEAYQALAKIDPKGHGLTKDQAEFLKETGQHFKEVYDHLRQRMIGLAGRVRKENVRPLVMQMLRGKSMVAQDSALFILTAWKDKEALPQIRSLMRSNRFSTQWFVAAYLSIDGGPQARKDVLDLLSNNDSLASDGVLRGIVTAAIPTDNKVTMLRDARASLKTPGAVPNSLRYQRNRGQDIGDLLVPLMDTETDVQALGSFCELAAADTKKRFPGQVRHAVERLSKEPAVAAGGQRITSDTAYAAQRILAAAAVYDLNDLAPIVQKLMGSENATIRAAAQAAGARLAIPGAMKDLYAQLDSADAPRRELAAKSLLAIKPANEAERAAREEAILACLGKPCEDYAMRVLTSCGGPKAVKALEAILDDPDARRAVYAAWVLAQLPDKAAAVKGLFRVAIFGLFNHQVYQQGEGIDFPIASDLYFHQVTGRLNRDPRAYSSGEGPVRIPNEFLQPFPWNEVEQQYAVRCYRLAEVAGPLYSQDIDFLRSTAPGMGIDKTQVPLLTEIAAHDSHVQKLMVQGQEAAHFEYRQLAAQALAAIRKEKASYIGLAGEAIDSAAFPQPYQDQDQLLARFFVDRVRDARLLGRFESDRQWERYHVMAQGIADIFGPQVTDAIRREADRRQVDMTNILPPPAEKRPKVKVPVVRVDTPESRKREEEALLKAMRAREAAGHAP